MLSTPAVLKTYWKILLKQKANDVMSAIFIKEKVQKQWKTQIKMQGLSSDNAKQPASVHRRGRMAV